MTFVFLSRSQSASRPVEGLLCLPWALTGRCGSPAGRAGGAGWATWRDCWLCLSSRLSVCLSVWWDLKPCSRDQDDQEWVTLCLAMGLRDHCVQ